MSPLQLFTRGIVKLHNNGVPDDFYRIVDNEYGIDYEGPVSTESDNNVIVPRIQVQLTEFGLQQLHQVNVLRDSDDMGTDMYVEILNIITQNSVN